ncbi:pseudouridine synthase [Aerococcus urinaehominis]|uniref:Pseudouridine synthase n=1 Tax=Aerococcus urinaehominis TaxID=128944 RepID=A0A0X8FLV4_9LACT|nr:pseudouridine synthase [Aerococcus urinaehominis]AMB99706.1 pseudouridine synthase [Aerococcus urinaehominis]SDL91309.1 23S rRNA pseudouridine2605 synthase [Aerococcus urinaehominis]
MERLQKLIAHAGVASRRKAEELIKAGRVSLDGQVVTELGTKASRKQRIEVDGVPIYKEEPVYYLFNKPDGVISAVSDDKGRQVVTDYFPEVLERIYPVGRLDYHTTGLLILTNDGEFANLLMHPSSEIKKTYVAKVEGIISNQQRQQLERGVVIDGRKTAPAQAKILSTDSEKERTVIRLTIHEGRNRQVRKMLEAVGHPVLKLKREQYGQLTLDKLAAGAYRPLAKYEVDHLIHLAKH